MMGHTHLAIGAAAGLAAGLASGATMPDLLALGAIGAIAALLPDIDHPNGTIRQKMGIVGHVGLFWLPHRGLTHTLLFLALVGLGCFYFLPYPLALAGVAGYGSHIIADMVTRAGLPVFWPLYGKPLHLLPRGLRIATGGIIEGIIFLAVLAALAYYGFEMIP